MVLAQDSRIEVPFASPRPRRHRRVAWFVVALTAVATAVAAAVAWFALAPDDQPSITAEAGPASATVAPAAVGEASNSSGQAVEAGWVRYGAVPALASGTTPPQAWIERPTPGSRNLELLQNGAERLEVRDQPGGGTVVGYDYVGLGFVSLAEAPGFDARAARVGRYGCDSLEPACAAKLTQKGPGAAGPVPPAPPPTGTG